MEFELLANLVTIIGLPIGVFTLFFGIRSVKQAKKVEQGTFLIELRKMFSQHDYVHLKLRNENNWIPDDDDWHKIDSYLGLFELCEILIQNNSLSENHFTSQYKYRLENIVANDQILSRKINNLEEDWEKLRNLFKRMNLPITRV